MKVAMLAPIAWRTPPRHYGPWEAVVSLLTEGLVARGVDVTLFATGDSDTTARLSSVVAQGWEEDPALDHKVWECLHIARAFERGEEFDLIHNHFDFLPLTYSAMTSAPLLTTVHGFSSPQIRAVYRAYDATTSYVAISDADRADDLSYLATVHHGIDLAQFTYRERPEDYLLFLGRIHPEKGTAECIEVARRCGRRLLMAGIVQDRAYFERAVAPAIDGESVVYLGSVGPHERDHLLGGAIALLHPISFDEPFGLSVVESMACGTPVIAFDRGSMAEVICHGVSGYLVHDLEQMAARVNEVTSLSRRDCRSWVEAKFTADRMVDDYIRVYQQLIGEAP